MSTEKTNEEFDFSQLSDEKIKELNLHELKPGVKIPMPEGSSQQDIEKAMKKAMINGIAEQVSPKAKVITTVLLLLILASLINGAIDLFNLIF